MVNMLRYGVVSLLRNSLVSLLRNRVVSITGFSRLGSEAFVYVQRQCGQVHLRARDIHVNTDKWIPDIPAG